jgi:hypothetical protein
VSYDIQVAVTISECCATAFLDGLRSVVLTGSLARGEGTWLRDGSRVRLAGDTDVFVIFDDRAPVPPPDRVARLQRTMEDRLTADGIDAHIGLSPVRSDFLRRLQPNIFSYELTTHGKVLWGDEHILKFAPVFTPLDIPLDDGFRLLMNRMIELLESVCEVDAPATNAPAVRYRAMKLWLDMATSYLLFQRQYVPTYCGRAARLRELATDRSALAPISLARFASRVALATRCKLGKSGEMREFADLNTLIDHAHSLWRWELERLTGSGASDSNLIRRWTASEPIAARLRGWAGVAKRYGAARAIAEIPNWIGLARTGSPRRLIYGAASELLFALPSLLKDDATHGSNSRWDDLRRGLPITDCPENGRSRCAWRSLGCAISFNYNFFLAPTRA